MIKRDVFFEDFGGEGPLAIYWKKGPYGNAIDSDCGNGVVFLDCDQIYAPYETTASIHCSADDNIILERSTTGSQYWQSLTAGVRLE